MDGDMIGVEQGRIGYETAAEWRESRDPETGRLVTQLTGAVGNSYPLYYFIPTISGDNRYLVFQSERGGWLQLYRLDLDNGRITQLSDGRTSDSGWGIWCTYRLRGIYSYLSALNTASGEVFYFQDDELRATHVATMANRLVCKLPPGRMPMAQNAVAPDGSQLAFVHADEQRLRAALAEREALVNMGLWSAERHNRLRNGTGDYVLEVVDCRSGVCREVTRKDYHFHHVLWASDETLLLNHPRDVAGMWLVDVDGRNERVLRPATLAGAHNADVVHQVVTPRGVFYEASAATANGGRANYAGCYDLASDTFAEVLLPGTTYVHIGHDPEGRFLFIEDLGQTHGIYALRHARDPQRFARHLIRSLRLPGGGVGQRNHGHPFLGPDRRWLYFTDGGDNGFNQIFRVDVADLVDRGECW